MHIRLATPFDAEAATAVLKRSIQQLCGVDHDNNIDVIAAWIENKTPESWQRWVGQARTAVYVAEDGSEILGVGMMSADGQILLNYVDPGMRFRGVSKALLRRMEAHAAELGLIRCTVESTKTALAFYRAMGFEQVDDGRGLMQKRLR